MSEINLRLKTYDELTFEISRLNIDKYLLEQKLQQKESIIKEAIEYIENKNKYLDKENYYQVFEYRDMYLIPLLDILKGSDKE